MFSSKKNIMYVCRFVCIVLLGSISFYTPNAAAGEIQPLSDADPNVQNAYITSVLLENNTNPSDAVVTFGQPFRKGDVPENMGVLARIDGKQVDIQVDVKTRWEDRSVKHAIISVRPSKTSGDMQVNLFRRNQPIDVSVLEQNSLLMQLMNNNYTMSLELEMPRQTLRVAVHDLLEEQLNRANNQAYWLNGPLIQEIRLFKKLSPEMRAVIDLRVDDSGAVRTSIGVHNDVFKENTNETFVYNARILLGSNVVWEKTDLRHYPNANWREVIWSGGKPSGAFVTHKKDYLVASRLVPPYDINLNLTNKGTSAFAKPLEQNAFSPFAKNGVYQAMPDTGYRPDLGMLPAWSVAALITQEPIMLQHMLANAHAAGGIPWHFRDKRTNKPANLRDHPNMWLDYRANVNNNGHVAPSQKDAQGWRIDSAHMPDLSYLPYLLTGDQYFLDELQFQIDWALGHSTQPSYRQVAGLWANDQVRAQGWQLRTLTYAAHITPDTDGSKSYYQSALDDRLKWYLKNHITEAKYGAPIGAQIRGWVHGYSVDKYQGLKPFMQDFFAMPIAYAALLGNQDALAYTKYMANFYAGRFTQDDFDPINANTYQWTVVAKNEQKFTTWKEVAEENFAKGFFKKDKQVIDGYAHMADQATGSARAGLALMASVIDDPLVAEAYAYVVSQTPLMDTHTNTTGEGVRFADNPQWAIVPLFPDGTVLSGAANTVATGKSNDKMTASQRNSLLVGMDGNDTLNAREGNDSNAFLIGWDGNDTILTGTGFTKVSAGRGNDTVIPQGGISHIRTGSGNDTIVINAQPVGTLTVYDYNASNDVIRIAKQRYDQDGVQGWLWEKNDSGHYQLQFSDNSMLVLNGLKDADLQNIRIDVVEK